MRGRTILAFGIALALGAGAAQAHSPYLLPNTFDASGRDHVTVQAGITEHFFIPEFAVKSDSFHVIGPDGVRTALTPITAKDVTLLEVATPRDGTWRISSGASLGRVGKAAMVNGQMVFGGPGKPLPEGAPVIDVQNIATSETYVSRGAPNDAALKPRGEGLEFQAITHPDKIAVGEPARFVLLLDGKPLAGQAIAVTRGDDLYSDDKPFPAVTTDARGGFTLLTARQGVYHAMARYRQPPPAAGGPVRNLAYALTFESVK